jgi:uncharacterized protein (TIGR02588 family)
MSSRLPRSRPEWVTFVVSCAVLAVIVALIASQAVGAFRPATPVAERRGAVSRVEGRFVVPVMVTNLGDETAQNVQIVAEFQAGDIVETGDQSIDFLSGGEAVTVYFVFDNDPDALSQDGSTPLRIKVSGYTEP